MSKKDTIYFVSGTWPPMICGVGDFMHNLSKKITEYGISVKDITFKKYSIGVFVKILIILTFSKKKNLVYIAYPTEGYGKSILPFCFSFFYRDKIIVHIHEYSSKNKYCRFLLRLFKKNKFLYFSNEHDMNSFKHDCQLDISLPSGWRLMPSPSNIPISYNNNIRCNNKLIYFGQIRPNKGLELVLSICSKLKENSDIEISVIGGVPTGYEEYALNLQKSFNNLGIEIKFNLPIESISYQLSSAKFGLFPFPDGADERRGSLIAALEHNLHCFTTYSMKTSEDLKGITFGVDVEGKSDSVISDELSQIIMEKIKLSKSERDDYFFDESDMSSYVAKKSFKFIADSLISDADFRLDK